MYRTNKKARIAAWDAVFVILLSAFMIATAAPVHAADHYVRADAAGKKNGGDWANAWPALPAELVRGDTYYIADGVYPPYVLDDAEQGAATIQIKKATPDNHGTEQGWKAAYGDGQAVFRVSGEATSPCLTIRTGYVIIDGQVGGGTSGYGFNFSNQSKKSVYVILIERSKSPVTHVTLKHSELQQSPLDKTDIANRGFQVHSTSSLQHAVISRCYIHDIKGVPIYFVNSSDVLVEYCHVARNFNDAARHAEGILTNPKCKRGVVRYCTWEDIEGTAVLSLSDHWDVYGNVFYYTSNYPNPGQNGCGVGMGIVTALSNNRIFNNTVCNMTGSNAAYYLFKDKNEVFNNIWANCKRLRFVNNEKINDNTKSDYHILINNKDDGGFTSPNTIRVKKDLFINAARGDFGLLEATEPGVTLSTPFDRDMKKVQRGGDGVWDRGAFEYRLPLEQTKKDTPCTQKKEQVSPASGLK